MDYNKKAVKQSTSLKGKLEIRSKAPLESKDDLSTAYTPGVAEVSKKVSENKNLAYEMTIKANSVAIVSDGSAVLGLGNIGPEGALPVMEGKAILFKEFAGVDAYPLVLGTQDTDEIISIVKNISPGFGGINLEDISAPRCFDIEQALQDIGIPVFHDDQHGTAIVVLAALINALKVVEKSIHEASIVISGAGAAGMAVANLLLCTNIDEKICTSVKNLIMVDSRGIITREREGLTEQKKMMSMISNRHEVSGSLKEAVKGADVFIGVSVKGAFRAEWVKNMADKPIIFAMANPEPEIMPDEALREGAAVVGTGRSDLPNQINNVLAFPGVFRGALDARATKITKEMQIAAAHAIADFVKSPSPKHIIPYALEKECSRAVAEAVAEEYTKSHG